MDPNIVLRKTEKGIHELKTRENRLPPTLRAVLILVDGKLDVDELTRKVPTMVQLVDFLGVLLKGGFITASNEDETQTDTSGVNGNNPATRAKWEIVEMAGEVLGEEFANRATRRFTAVPDTPEALELALGECCQFIALTIDEAKSKIVQRKGMEILSRIPR